MAKEKKTPAEDHRRYWDECVKSVTDASEPGTLDDDFYERVKACFYRRVHRKGRTPGWDYREHRKVTPIWGRYRVAE